MKKKFNLSKIRNILNFIHKLIYENKTITYSIIKKCKQKKLYEMIIS